MTSRKYEGDFWADKLMDLANLQIVVTVFGQFTTAKISLPVIIAGVIMYILIAFAAMKFREKL